MTLYLIAAVVTIGLGVALLFIGVRKKNSAEAILAPAGAILAAAGLRHLLKGIVPDPVLLSVSGIVLASLAYWMWRVERHGDDGPVSHQ